MSRGVKIVIASGAAILLVVIGGVLVAPQQRVPREFSESRIRGAALASDIANAASESIGALLRIREHDERKEIKQALLVISDELVRNKESQGYAIRLASELERMARLITWIRPERARVMATEAVSAEVALVSRLVSYNQHLRELFDLLQRKISEPQVSDNGKVAELIAAINEEARAINAFNDRFNRSLAEFDKLFVN